MVFCPSVTSQVCTLMMWPSETVRSIAFVSLQVQPLERFGSSFLHSLRKRDLEVVMGSTQLKSVMMQQLTALD